MIACLNVVTAKHVWILDLGAIDHMSHNILDFFYQTICSTHEPEIHLPYGQSTEISHIGHVKLANGLLLKDVLHGPSLKFTVLLVSKLIKHN